MHEVFVIPLFYKRDWQIEITFWQLKQNFGINYLSGDNENVVKIQTLGYLITNLLITLIQRKVRERRKNISF